MSRTKYVTQVTNKHFRCTCTGFKKLAKFFLNAFWFFFLPKLDTVSTDLQNKNFLFADCLDLLHQSKIYICNMSTVIRSVVGQWASEE